MNINVTINLGPDEYAADLSGNATEIANSILEAVGGDPTKDQVHVNISDYGTAGTMPSMAPMPTQLPAPEPVITATTDKK